MRDAPLAAAGAPAREWRASEALLHEPRYSSSLQRGLAILECFTPARPLLGIAELAELLAMTRSTTHRYVITLVELGCLRQDARRKYRLSWGAIDLGLATLSSTGLREHARPHLEALSRRTRHAVAAAVLDGAEILCVDRVHLAHRGRWPGGRAPTVGTRLPAYCTAMGKLLIAQLPARERRRLLTELRLRRRGPRTILSKDALRAELERVRAEGCAVNDEELAPGLCALAAPVRGSAGDTVAAVALVATPERSSLERLVEELGPHLFSTADDIAARLGHRRVERRPDR